MKFRKKPVVIEATQWFKNGDHPRDESEEMMGKGGSFMSEGKVVRYYRTPEMDGGTKCKNCGIPMLVHGWIDTLEGGHIVCPGDWIITGVKGEHYPCKPDVFKQTYELVEVEPPLMCLDLKTGEITIPADRPAQRQDSTEAQLRDVMVAANKMGCYDAADAIVNLLGNKTSEKTNEATEKGLREELEYLANDMARGSSTFRQASKEIKEILSRYSEAEDGRGGV